MSEREITKGDHLSHHFCVDTFGNNFDLDTTHYVIDQELSKIDIDLLDLYCDDELHPSLENDPNMQLFIAHTPSPHDGDNVNNDLSPPFLTDRGKPIGN